MADARIAVVTGAAEGLGQAFAERLARSGHDLVLADLAASNVTAELVKRHGQRVLSVECDVSSENSVQELAHEAAGFGGADVLVNNAGIAPFAIFEDLTFAEWRRIHGTNLDGAFLSCQALLPAMKAQGWGRVINIVSNAFIHGADPMLSGYISSKGGIIGLTRALGSEYGPFGITVNAVAPGLIATDHAVRALGVPGEPGSAKWDDMLRLQPIKRNGTPADVVGIVNFLASDEASYVTAQTIVVDGGLGRV